MNCPVKGCREIRTGSQIACREHWYALPLDLRNRIWDLFRNQRGKPAHLSAIQEALRILKKGETHG